MWFSTWAFTTALLLIEAKLVTSSALLHMPSFGKRNALDSLAWEASKRFEGDLERRSPQTTSTNGGLTLSTPGVDMNTTILSACTTAMQNMTSVSNEPGLAACYNILDWKENMGGIFQADLRLFQFQNATGQFTNVPNSAITLNLNYPNSTQYSSPNTKRSLHYLWRRQSGPAQIQQYSLAGNFKMSLNTGKLNNTEIMSLLIPQITLQATINGTVVSTQINPADTVYFVTGQFKDQTTPQLSAEAANPATAMAAIADSQGFTLPGTKFGVFPVGLIITGSWCLLFVLAFGLGTVGRLRHRDIYRKRVAATAGRGGKK